jgi:Rha family phage regulatory protein
MRQLVFIENNRPLTDTLIVSAKFGKRHDSVMRDVRDILEKLNTDIPDDPVRTNINRSFAFHNFVETPYVSLQNNQTYMKFNLTEEAFNLVVMGFTGFDAMTYKVAFINEFIRMREEIKFGLTKPSYMIDDPIGRAERWIQEERQRQELEELNKKREEQLTLQAPKVALYETAMNAKNNFTMERVSKTLGYGRNKLFEFLREQKVLRFNNLPYQEYIDRKYFDVRQYSITHNTTGIENKNQTLVTPKGVAYIHKLLIENGKIPGDQKHA